MSRTLAALLVLALLAATAAVAWTLGARRAEPPAAAARAPAPAVTAGDAPMRAPHPATPAPAATPALAPLPPPRVPIAEVLAELETRAVAGDAAAAGRIYHDLMHCKYGAAQVTHGVDWAANTLALGVADEPPDGHLLDGVELQLTWADDHAEFCGGLDAAAVRDVVPVMLRAARLGDREARLCYVHRGPYIDSASLLLHPEYLATYLREAPGLIDAAIADGDWRMVDMLMYAYHVPDTRSLVSGLLGTNELQYYRWLKLFSLGVDAADEHAVGGRVELTAETLDAADVAAADAWAQETFARHFRGGAWEDAPMGWDACAIDIDA